MDHLWSPWRFQYVSHGPGNDSCIFCDKSKSDPAHDAAQYILHRGRFNFILLNLYPYTTGHSMIVPYRHGGDFESLEAETLLEMMTLAQRLQAALKACYHPEGYNLGMNLGRCAGAGVSDHLHLHLLPRWNGDASFITVIGETRVEPEDLATTYKKLLPFFNS